MFDNIIKIYEVLFWYLFKVVNTASMNYQQIMTGYNNDHHLITRLQTDGNHKMFTSYFSPLTMIYFLGNFPEGVFLRFRNFACGPQLPKE